MQLMIIDLIIKNRKKRISALTLLCLYLVKLIDEKIFRKKIKNVKKRKLEYLAVGPWSRLYGLLTQSKICASRKSRQKFTKIF